MLNITSLQVGPFRVNCYLIWGATRSAWVIDPGAEPERILEALERKKLKPAAYLLTHGHMDHLSALAALHERWPAPYAIHAADYAWAFAASNQLPPYYARPRQPAGAPCLLEAGQAALFGDLACQVLSTPGHSPGSLCFYFKEAAVLFSGDTLFQGAVGRSDLPGSNQAQLTASLKSLVRLPARVRLYPGHGPASSLAEELRSNPFLAGGRLTA